MDSPLNTKRLHWHCSDDNVFRPASCQRDFDFTLLFEQTILSILPSVLLLAVVPFRVFRLYHSSIKTYRDLLLPLKAIAVVCYGSLQIALVVLWTLNQPWTTVASVPSTILSLIDSVAIGLLSFLEHKHSVRPSIVLNVYLFLSIVFDAAQVRTLYLTSEVTTLAAVMTAGLGIKVILLLLEAHEKTSSLRAPYNQYSPEAKSGLWNLSFFWWLNSLLRTGFNKLMTTEDLFDVDEGLSSETLSVRMHMAWNRTEHKGPYSLPIAAVYCFRWELLFVIFPRLCLVGFNFAQPFLITRAIIFLGEPQTQHTSNVGYALIAATALIYMGIALSTVHYKHRFFRILTMFRGAMIALIYDRTLTLVDGTYTESAALTLMSTDVDTIIEMTENVNEIWARALEIAIGIWLLARQVGAPCVVPVLVIIGCTFGQSWVARRVVGAQGEWNEAIQKRVAMTSSMLGSMKSIKIMGLSTTLSKVIQSQRIREIGYACQFLKYILVLNVLSNMPDIWSTLLTFAAYTIQNNVQGRPPLTTVQAFTSLAIISLVTNPAAYLLSSIPQSAAALGAFARIQKFLLSETVLDQRRVGSTFQQTPQGGSDSEGIELTSIRMDPTKVDRDLAIRVTNATICPAAGATPAISNLSFTVRKGAVTAIVGPIGSGKTTLLRAMLGELPCLSGSIEVASTRIAWCNQSAWLLNVSILQCVCGVFPGTAVDEQWYRKVMHACDLDQDIIQLPDGDQSILGSKGLTLSGGQKQRLALARAVYARQDVIMLDDVLSALDAKTEEIVVRRLIGENGVLRNNATTVVMITHAVRHLPLADSILVLGTDGRMIEQGTFDALSPRSNLSSLGLPRDGSIDQPDEVATPYSREQLKSGEIKALDPEDKIDLSRRTGDLSVYKYYVQSFGLNIFFGFLVIMASSALVLGFPQIWLQKWTGARGRDTALFLSIYALLAVSATVLVGLQVWIVFFKIMPASSARLHQTLLDTVVNAPISFFARTDSGVTLNRFSQDMSLVDGLLLRGVVGFGLMVFLCMMQLALISMGSGWMAITIPFLLLAIYFIQNVYLRTSRQLRLMDLEAKSPLYSHFLETLEGLATIRVSGSAFNAREINIKRLDASQKPFYLLFCVQRWLNLVLDLVVAGLALTVIVLAVQLRSTINGGLLGVSLNNILTFSMTLSNLVTGWTTLETSLGAIARVKSFEETTTPEIHPDIPFTPPAKWPASGSITLDSVSASYSSSPSSLALNDISLSLLPGQKVGVVGRTGSGKSSLLLALLQLLPLTAGIITIDGIDLSTIAPDELRARLTCIPQDPLFLSGSVRLNADPRGLVSDAALITALTKVRLWDLIRERGGLDAHMLAEVTLSQGQAQLFCLARAILRRDGGVVLVDEATSHMDADTDRVMQRVMREEFSGRTLVVVAHRLETVADADVVVVMAEGRVMECGAPEVLLDRKGEFWAMHQRR